LAAKAATKSIPIVFYIGTDPVDVGPTLAGEGAGGLIIGSDTLFYDHPDQLVFDDKSVGYVGLHQQTRAM
jgi:hypothetical protein